MNSVIYQGHYVRKNLGQNFLSDHNVIANIISAINPNNDQLLVEIGPGLGALTKQICENINKLIVIELDNNLIKKLKEDNELRYKLNIFRDNALKFDFKALSLERQKPIRIFGNLPYNISTTLIFYLFKYVKYIKDMHFMLQKEVADRMIVGPGNKKYGRLSVMTQYYCKIISLLEVNPISFIPAPKVYSTFIRLVPHKTLIHQVNNLNLLKYITTIAFSQRRKTLRNSLNKIIPISILKELYIDPSLRAENVSVSEYCSLANWLANDKNYNSST
ncbi:16S rRNA (adenine(1518)-N(6)/adenine(1519)-N(6))-dimethyltransferase RsmA [Candidatus Pantoea edessiphila]|uniref:Ribosomal RNA small subunit methyltransferase A n=1 Tax=Candidatus Pantoea edessiphila TaxID=2044610 RepID=A0A2P5SW74_9GAMM|nr:16S rRNA (adenine(1518)-N(6)/adenine(1519)-N(6))-dimethyltransferase RsmA [Candidatus Pantoea edessiphila]PPI86588.1 16S rRNA (adenine(1518)-N(6)/adenine(1519)-N(6))-dimethyltransferase [Candidatus Pantoea edessiphila]